MAKGLDGAKISPSFHIVRSVGSMQWAQMREALIPHWSATMSMEWEHPPVVIQHEVCRLRRAKSGNRLIREATEGNLAKRCGLKACQRITDLAERKAPVTWENMVSVQRCVVPNYAVFRNGMAYQASRNERYALLRSLGPMFHRKVRIDDRDNCHPVLKAARLYLDIIFFHPFQDGNSRAALLWFAFHCQRSGFSLPDFRPLVGFPFAPGNTACYWEFCVLAIREVMQNREP